MTVLADAIKKVATGPHLSKDLTQDEAYAAMTEILSGKADPVQAAIFFIALRIKRETDAENKGILQAMQAVTEQVTVDIKQLLTLSDPYNGYNRHQPIVAFLPAVLAASGLPTLSQGVWEMGPKFGITHAQVLAEAGVATRLSTAQIAQQISQTNCAWAYSDQSQASPRLYALQDLRTRMIKRPSLATLEKLMMPIKAQRNYLQIGFVHKEYPAILASVADYAGFDLALIVRGIEGSIVPTLREASNCFIGSKGEAISLPIDPTEFDIQQTTRGVLPQQDQPISASQTVELGLQALSGQTGVAHDSLVLAGAMALWQYGVQTSPQQAADVIRHSFKSGKAKAYFEQGIKA